MSRLNHLSSRESEKRVLGEIERLQLRYLSFLDAPCIAPYLRLNKRTERQNYDHDFESSKRSTIKLRSANATKATTLDSMGGYHPRRPFSQCRRQRDAGPRCEPKSFTEPERIAEPKSFTGSERIAQPESFTGSKLFPEP